MGKTKTDTDPNSIAENFFSQDTSARIIEYSKSAVSCIRKHLQDAYGYSVEVAPGKNTLQVLHEDARIERLRGAFDGWLRDKHMRKDDLTGLWCLADDVTGRIAYAHSIWEAFAGKKYECGVSGEQLVAHWRKWGCDTPSGWFVPSSPWEAETNMLSGK